MSRLSGHLSQVGALIVAIVAAAVAYSVYDAGSTTSNPDAREPVAGLLADSGDSLRPDSDRQEEAKRVREPNVGRTAGPSSAEAVRPSWPATGLRGQLSEPLLQNVSAPLPRVSAPLPHDSTPLPSRPGPFDDRTLDRELQRLIGDKPLPRVPKGPAEDFPTDLPPELIKGPGAPAPKPVPESPNVPAQPGVPSPPTPVAPPPTSPTPATPAAGAPSESTPDEDADSGGAEDDVDDTDTGTTTPPPPAEPAPVPADPDDQTGNADDEDASGDDQSGEAEDESPVPPGGSEGADDGVAGDGDDAVAPPAPSAPAVVAVEEGSGPGAAASAAPADQVDAQPVDAGLPVTGAS